MITDYNNIAIFIALFTGNKSGKYYLFNNLSNGDDFTNFGSMLVRNTTYF